MLAVQLHNDRYHTEMAAALTEGALDLSKTSDSRSDSKASSPVPSMNSDIDSQQALDHQDRSDSVPSDGNETDSSTGPAVKAISAHPKLSASHQFTPEMLSAAAVAAAAAGGGAGLPPSLRPFKMYPMERGNHMYPAIPAVPTLSPELNLSQLSPGATLGPMAMMDPNIGISCSPIAQYIQQRKRRADRSHPTALDADLKKSKIVPEEEKDEHYWERRRKNNDAAKRSRDARRRKEEEIALRAAFLEQENLKLRAQVAILKNETAKLHYMLYNRM